MYLDNLARAEIKKIAEPVVKEFGLTPDILKIEYPSNEAYGDFSLAIALSLAQKSGSNPRDLAKKIISKFDWKEKESLFTNIEVAGPGFINFKLKPQVWLAEIKTIISQGEAYGSQAKKKKRILMDYSSPNIAKSFSIGHLVSTLIGQALANIYQFLGWQVIADNHLGDWGSQFGIIIAAVERKKLAVKNLSIKDLEKLYVEFNQQMKADPDLKKISRQAFSGLEKEEKNASRIWAEAVKLSLKEFDKIYKQLEVLQYSPPISPNLNKINPIKYVAYGESFYQPYIKTVIKELSQKGLIEKDQGSLLIRFPDLPPAILIKTDGATTYFARDLATLWYRQHRPSLKSDIYLYEVGSEQNLYLKQVFATAIRAGWVKEVQLVHIGHGLVRLPEGKMSTRQGRVIKVSDLIKNLNQKAGQLISNPQLSPSQKKDLSHIVGIGALKFNQMKKAPATSYVFKWQEALDLSSNSGPYIQYTFARCQSVLAKTEKNWLKTETNVKLNPAEIKISRWLARFPDTLASVASQYSPNLLAGYLSELASRYNSFYNTYSILKAEKTKRHFRLELTQATAIVLKTGLALLGIRVATKM